MISRYDDRADAGRRLAELLAGRVDEDRRPVVLALPRGGVPVAVPIARHYRTELDIVAVRKIGVPFQPELAMGALARIGDRVEELRNTEVITATGVSERSYQEVLAAERAELDARHRMLRRDRPGLDLRGRTVIIVDDGLATGTTMLAAIEAVRRAGASRIVAAVPVASPRAAERVRESADELVCSEVPASFQAVGQAYRSFDPVPTADVRRMLDSLSDHDR